MNCWCQARRQVTSHRSGGRHDFITCSRVLNPQRGCSFPRLSRHSMRSNSPSPSNLHTHTLLPKPSLGWCFINLYVKVLRTAEFPVPVFNSEEVWCLSFWLEVEGKLFLGGMNSLIRGKLVFWKKESAD